MSYTIEVDFDVYKRLTYRRTSEESSYNDVLREMLELDPVEKPKTEPPVTHGRSWVGEGVTLPHGTELRAAFKGALRSGRIENGSFVVNGQSFKSPSAAAVHVVGRAQNGWIFWECRCPGATNWVLLNSLRNPPPAR